MLAVPAGWRQAEVSRSTDRDERGRRGRVSAWAIGSVHIAGDVTEFVGEMAECWRRQEFCGPAGSPRAGGCRCQEVRDGFDPDAVRQASRLSGHVRRSLDVACQSVQFVRRTGERLRRADQLLYVLLKLSSAGGDVGHGTGDLSDAGGLLFGDLDDLLHGVSGPVDDIGERGDRLARLLEDLPRLADRFGAVFVGHHGAVGGLLDF